MIGVYLICFVAFPAAMIIPMKIVKKQKEVLLEKTDTNMIKGVAACLVILCHLIVEFKREITLNPFLNIFWLTGAMGVLLFFFVSGYGIWKGYSQKSSKSDKKRFWRKRFLDMYLPCVLIQFVFSLIKMFQREDFGLEQVIYESFFYAWFIVAILIQYAVFFLSWIITKGRQNRLIIWDFLFNMIVALLFYIFGFNARWYNSMWLFPIGMAVAWKEKNLIVSMNRRWILHLILYFFLFMGSGVIRTYAYWGGSPAGTDVLKVISGACMSLFICALFLRLQFCSPIMKYIGKRSLFFYVVHIELLAVIPLIEGISVITIFYVVIALTFLLVEICYRFHGFCKGREQKAISESKM